MSAPASVAPEIAVHFVQVIDSVSDSASDDGGGSSSRVEIPRCMGVRHHMMNYLHIDRDGQRISLEKHAEKPSEELILCGSGRCPVESSFSLPI